jgi:chemotaxis protein histidine kinase CheA/CheY-like chemotaxis protein
MTWMGACTMSNNFDKFAILESFLDEVGSYLPEIESNLDRLQQRPGDHAAIEETYRRTHTIGGSAALMDFPELAHVAQGMEEILGDALDGVAPLEAPAIGLLRRSFGRLARLTEQVRTGVDGSQLVAEDDADRAASRGHSGTSVPASSHEGAGPISQPSGPFVGEGHATMPPLASVTGSRALPDAESEATAGPRLPDWLAAFNGTGVDSPAPTGPQPGLTPPASASTDPWATSLSTFPTAQHQAANAPLAAPPSLGAESRPGLGKPAADASFDEVLQAFRSGVTELATPDVSTGPMARPPQSGPATPAGRWGTVAPTGGDLAALSTGPIPAVHGQPQPDPNAQAARITAGPFAASVTPDTLGGVSQGGAVTPDRGGAARALMAVSPAWEELQIDEEAVRRQVGALRDVVATLREAAQAMEDERTELRSFLDGSKEALDRLEDWAGQAMGLDLRRSPEHVRRYLPLSVIWVTTTRLKKLVTLLNNSGRRITASQEEIEEALRELHHAIESVGSLYSSVAAVASASGMPAGDGTYSATVAQVAHFAWNPAQPTAAQRPGASVEPAASPGAPALETGSEAHQLPPGARAELERTVRDELRRELEDEVRGEVAAEVRREEEARLRQELEIQVRRQVLAGLNPALGATGFGGTGVNGQAPLASIAPAVERKPTPVRVTEQSAEALDVFREEAEEHLQQIALGIRQLETNPADAAALQSVRRATHTLKGAAGMMGFASIQQLAHSSEDLLERLVGGAMALTPEVLGLLLDASEALERLAAGTVGGADEEDRLVTTLQRRYAALLGRPAAGVKSSAGAMQPAAGRSSVPQLASSGDPEGQADLSVRLRLSKLDELVNLFGELLQNRTVLEERVTRLSRMIADTSLVSHRLSDVGSQLETRFEAATLPSSPRTDGMGGAAAAERPASGRGFGGVQARPGAGLARGSGSGPFGVFGRGAGNGAAHVNEFDELELDRYTEFHRLSRGLNESVTDMGTLSSEMESLVREVETIFARENRLSSAFQDRLMKARLVPLQTLVPRLYRAARAAAIKQNKEVEFFVEGGETEVDRTVHEEVAGPLLHLVRNAVVHAVEQPDARVRAGKPRAGRVVLAAAEEGNQVVIRVRDDGAGIDAEKVRIAALQRGLIDSYSRLTHQEALNLIFQPGLSTSTTIDEESGRGVGLDVVKDTVSRLRGTVEVESQPGQGTTFTLRIPVSLQITRAVLVRVGPQTFAIPMTVVEQIGRLDYYERVRGGGPPAVEVRGQVYPLAHLSTYLDIQPSAVDERSPVLLVNTGKQRMALLLDQIPGRQEVVAKGLGPHLRDVRGVAGATVLGNGQVVLILNLLEVLAVPPRTDAPKPPIPEVTGLMPRLPTSAETPPGGTGPLRPDTDISHVNTGTIPATSTPTAPPSFVVTRRDELARISRPATARFTTMPPTAAAGGRSSYVLVVDDSPSVRRVVSNMLKANGWDVQSARDGVEALEVVARETPAAVLLDIEMPRMDGYELMATLRSQPQYRQLPLIVLTSRAATKHQQRALQLGANAYVVKPYQDEELLNTINGLVAAQHPS